MYDVTGVIAPYPSFSSITPDQIELERRERHQCVPSELPNPMIYFFVSERSSFMLTSGQGQAMAGQVSTLT